MHKRAVSPVRAVGAGRAPKPSERRGGARADTSATPKMSLSNKQPDVVEPPGQGPEDQPPRNLQDSSSARRQKTPEEEFLQEDAEVSAPRSMLAVWLLPSRTDNMPRAGAGGLELASKRGCKGCGQGQGCRNGSCDQNDC